MSNPTHPHCTADMTPERFGDRQMPLGDLPVPGPAEIHAWFLDLPRLAGTLRGALDGHLGPDDPAPFTPGQLKFARRFFLRLLLGAYLGVPGRAVKINRSNRGKPLLDATQHRQNLHFSMAKSGGALLVGIATAGPLGVDLEEAGRRPRRPLALAARYFSEAETAGLTALPEDLLGAAFLRTWACKEAVVKASGEGIANQLCRFTVETDPARPVAVLACDDGAAADWSLALLRPGAAHLGAVAMRAPGIAVRAWRLLPAAAG